MSVAAALGARVLADPTDVGSETLKGGPLAILVIAVLCIGCFFLFRSMSRHLRHVRDEFPVDGTSVDTATAGRTATDDAAGTPATPPTTPGSVRPAPKSRARTDHPADR